MKLLKIGAIVLLLASCATMKNDVGTSVAVHDASAGVEHLNAVDSDPAKMGWMVGSPPPADKSIYIYDGSYFQFPATRWTFSNFRQLMPTVNVSRGLGNPSVLTENLDSNIDAIEFTPLGSTDTMTWEESLYANYTDGMIILHKGDIVYEKYFGVLAEDGEHGAMSMTKSLTGTLAAMLVADGVIDENKLVKEYVPELAVSGFGDATVRQVMDMTTAIKFSEDYSDPNAEIWQHAEAGNPLPKPAGYTGPRNYYEFLVTVEKEGVHGDEFHYKTANTDVLGWIIDRATGMQVNELMSKYIWEPIGAEQDAYFSIDSIGTPFAGGGLSAGLRDLARFGQMILQDGYYNGKQVLPADAVADIKIGGDPEKFKAAGYKLLEGWSYRNMWWITNNEHKAFAARGVYGQTIYIDPVAEMVVVRFASHPTSFNSAMDPTSLPAFHAVAEYLLTK